MFFLTKLNCKLLFFQLEDIAQAVHNLAYSKQSWYDIEKKYPKFEQQESKSVWNSKSII